jgi:hypothetical protein
MKTYTITNIDYSGNDFCGELSGEEAVAIFDLQPKSYTMNHDDSYDDLFEEVSDFFYEEGLLTPTSFEIDGVKYVYPTYTISQGVESKKGGCPSQIIF